jgi:mRNA-degrading endonuclease toxin of MazEF toxin-antitoxin module
VNDHICAPIYSEVLGLTTEVVLGLADGLPRTCAIRCDFLTLMFRAKLTHFVATLSPARIAELNRALAHALDLPLGARAP